MDNRTLSLVYLVMVLAYVVLMAQRNLAQYNARWKLRAAGAWVLIFAGLFVVASWMGWRLP